MRTSGNPRPSATVGREPTDRGEREPKRRDGPHQVEISPAQLNSVMKTPSSLSRSLGQAWVNKGPLRLGWEFGVRGHQRDRRAGDVTLYFKRRRSANRNSTKRFTENGLVCSCCHKIWVESCSRFRMNGTNLTNSYGIRISNRYIQILYEFAPCPMHHAMNFLGRGIHSNDM